MEAAQDSPAPPLPNAAALGFVGDERSGWVRSLKGREVQFRVLRALDELAHAERLQEDVFGVAERDLIPANELIVVAETGGVVLAAFLRNQSERAAGVLIAWGGFVGHPRMVSDFLAVRSEVRNLGLAAELKRLQAAVALGRGFSDIVWTVDPLRAANARLNFGKLGAVAARYEIDRYGATFATDLYGGMPTDRLHVTWPIATPSVIQRLLGDVVATGATAERPPPFTPGIGQPTTRVDIPTDIDALLAHDLTTALVWRYRVRDALLAAFAEGYVVTGFQPAADAALPALILEQLDHVSE